MRLLRLLLIVSMALFLEVMMLSSCAVAPDPHKYAIYTITYEFQKVDDQLRQEVKSATLTILKDDEVVQRYFLDVDHRYGYVQFVTKEFGPYLYSLDVDGDYKNQMGTLKVFGPGFMNKHLFIYYKWGIVDVEVRHIEDYERIYIEISKTTSHGTELVLKKDITHSEKIYLSAWNSYKIHAVFIHKDSVKRETFVSIHLMPGEIVKVGD